MPVVFALAHAIGLMPLKVVDHLDGLLYDVRLRATMPNKPDPRVVIVDIDEASLHAEGQWPWPRSRLAQLVQELTQRQHVAALGFDVVFAEPDPWGGDSDFVRALQGQQVVLGYYFSPNASAPSSGRLPTPFLPLLPGAQRGLGSPCYKGFGAPIASLARATAGAGFITVPIDEHGDGTLRAVPLLVCYQGRAAAPGYYASLGLELYLRAAGIRAVAPVFAPGSTLRKGQIEALALGGPRRITIPLNADGRMLLSYRSSGGPSGKSFRYVSAEKVLSHALAPDTLRDDIVLVGASAPGLQDLRETPVSNNFPGVEIHANVVSSLLDGRFLHKPDYAAGYEVAVLLVAGFVLVIGVVLLPVFGVVALTLGTLAAVTGLNVGLFVHAGLVFPLASALLMIGAISVINMYWGGFVDSRTHTRLVELFGSYVPPELVRRMLDSPQRYTMRAESRELTVMFCDIRGFTALTESMPPLEVQALLNRVFSELTEVINRYGGTIDKYMGDCVMAFWGAPMELSDHAHAAMRAAIKMPQALAEINAARRAAGQPELQLNIGVNTGVVSVGDMGSKLRRSYTVIGDAVNLAARLQSIAPVYGVDIIVGPKTPAEVRALLWMPLDRVQVQGKTEAVDIYTPLQEASPAQARRLGCWMSMLQAYRSARIDLASTLLNEWAGQDTQNPLYLLYRKRIDALRLHPPEPGWDGSSRLDRK